VMLLNACLAAHAGILYAGRLHGARYTLGENDVMLVVAAVIIGGTSLFGGKGTVIGSIVGALIMGMVNNGLILMGLTVDQQMIFRGVIIILSVTLTMGKK
ncbi:MAG: ABC transporter permease, partial [Planctomycetes bacterium]|nr:ABC transporter permease [Planctomycetota bacterium]